MGDYRELYQASIKDPAGFWAQAADAVTWTRRPERVLDDTNPPFYRWFPDGELNTCVNALDRHVADGRAEQPALIYDSPVPGSARTFSYRELPAEVGRLAGVLSGRGVTQASQYAVGVKLATQPGGAAGPAENGSNARETPSLGAERACGTNSSPPTTGSPAAAN